MTFTLEQRIRHVAQLIAPEQPQKQDMLVKLPLFQVAVHGGDAVKKPWGRRNGRRL
jgi:hypothetical protein